MERDFLGSLGSKNKPVSPKDEIADGINDSAPSRASAMQWSFSNKVSAVPQLLSFRSTQDDGTRKTGFDSLTSSAGFMAISNSEAFVQRKSTPAKQVGTHYSVTTYPPQQFDGYPRPHEVGIFPSANQTNQKISVTMSTPAHQSFLASAGHNVNPLPLGGVPVTSPISIVPRSTSVVGSTDLRNASKPSGGPAQLTIFYAGSVCVYDDISPEKAQAIMLLAGNGNSAAPNNAAHTTQMEAPPPKPSSDSFFGNSTTASKAAHTTQVEAPVPKHSAADSFIGKQSYITSTRPSLRTPISVSYCVAPQSASTGSADITRRAIGTLTPTSNKPESSKVVTTAGPVSSTLIPSAVPQARKASLARFLERRKDRVMSASPYGSKQTPDSSSYPGSDRRSFSMNTAVSFPLPATN